MGAGLYAMIRYEQRPGPTGPAALAWPAESSLQKNPSGVTLIMSLHPMCSCSRASVAELARVVAHARQRMRVYVLAVVPETMPARDWERTSLLSDAREIPGVRTITDIGGVEAKRFGAQTSGHVSVYSADGRLLFS